jgi:NADPH:quinone reductase-like Zn-dependent oxidoreductase
VKAFSLDRYGEQDVALKPKNLTLVEAASIPLVGLTAWQALVELGQLAQGQTAPWFVKLVTRLLSSGARSKAKRRGVTFSFLFMKASGVQLRHIAALLAAGRVRPVVDGVFPFQSTNEAPAYVETGRAKGKVVIQVK